MGIMMENKIDTAMTDNVHGTRLRSNKLPEKLHAVWYDIFHTIQQKLIHHKKALEDKSPDIVYATGILKKVKFHASEFHKCVKEERRLFDELGDILKAIEKLEKEGIILSFTKQEDWIIKNIKTGIREAKEFIKFAHDYTENATIIRDDVSSDYLKNNTGVKHYDQ